MASRELSLPKLENQNEFGCLLFEEQAPFGVWEQPYAYNEGFNLGEPSLFEFEPYPLAQMNATSSQIELNDFEEISNDLGWWDFNVPSFPNDVNFVDSKSIVMSKNNEIIDQNHNQNVGTIMYDSNMIEHQREYSNSIVSVETKRNGRYKSSALELEEIQKYFDVPITRAAKELNVGLTVLKKRCRELNIMRWPHRKIKSLKSLIHNVKELGLTNEIEMLEEHRKLLEIVPEMELTERTKKLRQACFKANYKKRRSMQLATID